MREKSLQYLPEQLEACERIGAKGLVVHGGHPTGAGTLEDGIRGWVEVLTGVESSIPILIENTAGGKAAVARRLAGFRVLWDALKDTGANVGTAWTPVTPGLAARPSTEWSSAPWR